MQEMATAITTISIPTAVPTMLLTNTTAIALASVVVD